jgi:hypothetical protein
MAPFILALCAWIDFDRRRKQEYYFLALGLFFVAMLCKPTMVMFPVLILLFASWKHERITWRDLGLSLPFFAISAGMSLLVIVFQPHGVGEETIPLAGVLSRLACAGTSIVFYFSRCFLPVLLAPIYPQWQVNPPQPWQFAPWLLLFIAIHWLWTKRAPWARNVLFGFAYFVINLVPFVGFHAVSFMRFAWTMDHFLYLPILGLLALVVAAMGDLATKLTDPNRRYAIAGVALVAVCFTIGSHEYAKTFASSEAQWTYTIQRFPYAWPAHNNLGNAYADSGRSAEAGEQYREALAINPGYPEAHNNLGIIYARSGNVQGAIDEFQLALHYCPVLESAKDNLARVQEYQRLHPTAK